MIILIDIVTNELNNFRKFASDFNIDVIKTETNFNGNLTITVVVDSKQALIKLYEFLNGENSL